MFILKPQSANNGCHEAQTPTTDLSYGSELRKPLVPQVERLQMVPMSMRPFWGVTQAPTYVGYVGGYYFHDREPCEARVERGEYRASSGALSD